MTTYKLALPLFALLAGCGDDTSPSVDASAPDLSVSSDLSHATPSQKLKRTDLVSDTPDGGVSNDPNLVNAWGLAFAPTGPIWVADNHSGLATVYTADGAILPLVVTVPPPAAGSPPSAPTGQIFNATTAFMGDKFIFSTEDGTISGWQTGTIATLRADNSTANAVYKGLTMATQSNVSRLYATDFHNGKVDVFDTNYAKVTTTGGFTNQTIPAGFAPFGVQAVGATIYVTYAKQDATAHDDVKAVGNGFVDVFDFDGTFKKRLVSNGALNSPWGVVVAPADFGALSNALLIGNFGDGLINGYDATTGALIATAADSTGAPLHIDGLWALVFGNDTASAAHNRLFFTGGPNDENDGVLGHLDLAP